MEGNIHNKDNIYAEGVSYANHYRVQQKQELFHFVDKMRVKADEIRGEYINPDYSSIENYKKSILKYRKDFIQMLGFPDFMFKDNNNIPEADVCFVAEDRYGKIFRLIIYVSDSLSTYGLLYLPKSGFPCPLVIAQHGGDGTPEKCCGLNGPSAYNNMVRRIVEKGAAVFAPQLTTWAPCHGSMIDRVKTDSMLKQLGSSLVAVEIYKIMRSLDYLLYRNDIDPERVGMMGVSYGGFYSLYTAAADTRIKAVIASCSFTWKYEGYKPDRTWNESSVKFLNAELCSLICPRKLYIEVGMYDEVFDYKPSAEEYKRTEVYYQKLGIPDRLVFNIHPYGHVFDWSDTGIDFLMKGLKE